MNRKLLIIAAIILCSAFSAAGQAKFVKNLSKGKAQTFVVYGTSVESMGAGRIWVAAVGEELNRKYKGELTLHNSGRSGQNSRWALEHLQDSVIAKSPDAVLIEFATNDAVQRFDISLEECRSNTLELISRIREAFPQCEIILQVTCGNPLGKNLESRPTMMEYNAVYAQIAKEMGLILIDEASVFRELAQTVDDRTFRLYCGDGVHSSKKGAMEIYFPVVMNALAGKKGKYVVLPDLQ